MNTTTDSPPENAASAIVKREPIAVGERGVKLTTFDDIYRFARVVVASKFCPRDFNEADCFICISRGLEIGLSPLVSLESIYVVNNRATLFGDAPKALCEGSGLLETYEQHYEGKEFDDDFKAVVTSKRKGREPMTETFSVADAKRAQLWDKKSERGSPSPWVLYPKRMLMFRARGYNLRDNFGDVLKGFQIGELVDDFDSAKQTAGRVVEPNFDGQPPAQLAAELPQAWQPQNLGTATSEDLRSEKRHRRTKAEMEAARAAQSAQDAPQPAATVMSPPPPETRPEASGATALFTNEPKEQPPLGPAAEVMLRLNTLGIAHEKFLLFLESIGTIGADPTDISMGHYVIGHVPTETLQLALKDWDKVIAELKGNGK